MAKCTASAVIAEARKWVGYCEKKSDADLDSFTANAGKNNYTRFNRDYAAATGSASAQPEQWCGIFVSMAFVYAFGLTAAKELLGDLYMYTPSGANRFRKKGRYIRRGEGAPQPGDVIFFYSESKGRIGHTGIVCRATASRVYTIEGNTSGGSALVTNGGCVAMKSYRLTSTYIDGYGRPDYAAVEAGADTRFDLELGDRTLTNGCAGDDVRELQAALISLGYDCGSYGADGDFGDCTELAVTAFQKDRGCTPDGEYGPVTHAAMEAALREAQETSGEAVIIENGQCWVRSEPDRTDPANRLGVAERGSQWPYAGERSESGWLKIEFHGLSGWVSGKYGRLK